MTTVEITREKLYPTAGASYQMQWKWTYNYRVDGGPVCQYGPGLTSLMDMLRHSFAGARVVKSWEHA